MRKWVIVGIVLALMVANATPALAQAQPFRGLFGPEPGGRESRRR